MSKLEDIIEELRKVQSLSKAGFKHLVVVRELMRIKLPEAPISIKDLKPKNNKDKKGE